ncbi:MAG: pur operon repressor [Clostridium sp.]|uniref:pur operon repressor n=1 Tax=Clostridium sp. TaxID=1506 RepID=UPI0025BF1965|nr:pur operon repressor [Clostridium sp.]MCH3965609.1 pur operon repressor [Clostridium sp.]MCI1717118.1 pur operon repressor [Clostridium sp.]MCI1801477.1 pur operon repressor [Clostridium sp.]MCI1815304.1 pur operon repressor [Clostridium sp.]MCI1872226.1 pur operon repressor [Clostridium sp.]
MQKLSRNQRISAITKILLENPNKIISLNRFTEMFNTAKSTVSEDIVMVKDTFIRLYMGKVETVSGAAGGVKYVCGISAEKSREFAEELCIILKNRERIIPGNFLYMTDIMFNPEIINTAGIILASEFIHSNVDYVVTVETKGIPLAYEVARMLGVQMIVVRRETKFTEGSTITINYVSGSTGRIQNMSLSKKAMKPGSKCIFIDDFMKAGGTARGIMNLLKEFESELLGIGVLMDNVETPKKLVQDYISIVDFKGIIDGENGARLFPSKRFN